MRAADRRVLLKRDRLAQRMGLDVECPVKPKWMRWDTYDQLMSRLEADDQIWGVEMIRRFGTKW